MLEQYVYPMSASCPHLARCTEVAYCDIADEEVLQIDGVDIRLCTSRHYEVCYVYSNSLRKEIFNRPPFSLPKGLAVPKRI